MLDELRVAKIVSIHTEWYEHILSEAKLMKNIKHSGIPVIYDIVFDKDSICVIEEYICGNSLTQYLKLQKNMTTKQICDIGIQLCNILEYMHEYGDHGILHLDLKPEHVLIDSDQKVYLIDFDHSHDRNQVQDQCYGSIGFAAPEQYHRLSLDRAADIYSLGMLILFMSGNRQNLFKVENLRLKEFYPIILKCLKHSPVLRYRSVKNVRADLQKISKRQLLNITERAHNIYVFGTRRGVGTTHLALCMTSYLVRTGKRTVCVEKADQQDLREEALKGKLDHNGLYELDGAYLLPNYQDHIDTDLSLFDFKVYDCGVLPSKLPMDGLVLLVGNIGYRRDREELILSLHHNDVRIFLNHMSGESFYSYIRHCNLNHICYRMPCVYNWKTPNTLLDQTFSEMLKEVYPASFQEKRFVMKIQNGYGFKYGKT